MKLYKALILIAALMSTFVAQAINLSAEQQAKLDSLPPALRKQALQELSKFNESTAAESQKPVQTPVVVVPKETPTDEKIEEDFEETIDPVSTEEKAVAKTTEEKELKQFGYDLFAGTPTTFAPTSEIPIPSDYVIGPGDQVRIQYFGKQSGSIELYVGRDGSIQIPDLGPISAAGKTFDALREEIKSLAEEQQIGVKAFVSLGELRSIRIFMLGEVSRPGSYTVSSLSTLTNALFVSGGISPIGSLRNIQLKRAGEIVTTFDLYDLLLKGDTSNDARIQPGDVIFVPPVGTLVGVSGEVKRPAIYELKSSTTANELIALSGGYTPNAFPSLSQIERITKEGIKEVIDLDLTTAASESTPLSNGDVLKVYSTLDRTENVVTLSGMVDRPGVFQWYEGMVLTDVITNLNDLLPTADLNYVVIERQEPLTGLISVLSVDLIESFNNPSQASNPKLHAKDKIHVFSDERATYRKELDSIVAKLQHQATFGQPAQIVTINGSVRHQGTYPLKKDMTIADLITASGNLTVDAYTFYSLIERKDHKTGYISVVSTNLHEALQNPKSSENHVLLANDKVYILNENSETYQETISSIVDRLRAQATSENPEAVVKIGGDVKHPGEYPLEKNMTISDLIRAAGQFTQSAFVSEAELVRTTTGDTQRRDRVIIPINLDESADLQLQGYDQLLIKRIPEWSEQATIELKGEVRFPGFYSIERGETLTTVLKRAGGLSELAHPEAAVFMRESLRQSEAAQVQRLKLRLEEDIKAANLQEGTLSTESLQTAGELVSGLESSQAIGRLVIDLPKLLENPNDNSDITLKDGDVLMIPQQPQAVTIIGSVNYPTSHFYDPRLKQDDYIALSGGLQSKADKRAIYVVRANGRVEIENRSRFFPNNHHKIQPGDTIVVPMDIDRMKPLVYWGEVSQIVYQLALGAAAVSSF